MLTAQQLIDHYALMPHPEGGWYKEMYKSLEFFKSSALPKRYSGKRSFCTFIYFLIAQGEMSGFHRIQSDEIWHFYAGGPLQVFVIKDDGTLVITELGNDISAGQTFHYVVPNGLWFASRPAPGVEFSFVGCTVAPGFEFDDFEMAQADKLVAQFPQHEAIIRQLCL